MASLSNAIYQVFDVIQLLRHMWTANTLYDRLAV